MIPGTFTNQASRLCECCAAAPVPEPEGARTIPFGVEPARDFAPERARNANVYEAVADHVSALRKSGRKVVLASYSAGARERLKGLLADHGLTKIAEAETWQEALGAAAKGQTALAVIQLAVYGAMQIPVGLLLDRFGVRLIVTASMVLMALG